MLPLELEIQAKLALNSKQAFCPCPWELKLHTCITIPGPRENYSSSFINYKGEGYGDGPINKCMPCKHKDLSSIPRTPLKKRA